VPPAGTGQDRCRAAAAPARHRAPATLSPRTPAQPAPRLRGRTAARTPACGPAGGAGGRRDDQRRLAACRAGAARRPAPARVTGTGAGARRRRPRLTRRPCGPSLPPMFHIVLVEPEIPPNTGNVIRLAANTGCALHLIEPLGFSMEDRHMRRAGLDYHEYAPCAATRSWPHFWRTAQPDPHAPVRVHHPRHAQPCTAVALPPGDWLVFGSESRGLTPRARYRPFRPPAAAAADARGPAQPEPVQRRGGDGVRGLAPERLRRLVAAIRGVGAQMQKTPARLHGLRGSAGHRLATQTGLVEPSRSTTTSQVICMPRLSIGSRTAASAGAQAAAHRHRRGEAHLVQPVVDAHATSRMSIAVWKNCGISDRSGGRGRWARRTGRPWPAPRPHGSTGGRRWPGQTG
jgi:tRNA (cytidine/uridine-2'-O-)-methyltransferase